MAKAFGVEQDIDIAAGKGPTGNDMPFIGSKNYDGMIVAGITDFMAKAGESVRLQKYADDITSAQTKLESVAAGGNAAELLMARREAERDLIKKHPKHMRETSGLLDQFGDVRTVVSPDGGNLQMVDKQGTIISQKARTDIPADSSLGPIADQAKTDAVNGITQFSVNFPKAAMAADNMIKIVTKADPDAMGKHDSPQINQFFSTINEVPNRIDTATKRFRTAMTSKSASLQVQQYETDRAKTEIVSAVLDGLNGFDIQLFHDIVGDNSNVITPNLITNMMHQYSNDVMSDMGKDGTFALLGLEPQTFQGIMRTAIEAKEKTFQASFTQNNDALKRTSDYDQYTALILKNQAFISVAGTPEGKKFLANATRVEIAMPVIQMFNVIDVMTARSTQTDMVGDIARKALNFVTDGTPSDLSAGFSVPKDWKNQSDVITFVKNTADAMQTNKPAAIYALVQGYANIAALRDAVQIKDAKGTYLYSDADRDRVMKFTNKLEAAKKAADDAYKKAGTDGTEAAIKKLEDEITKVWNESRSGPSITTATRPRPTKDK